MRYWHDLLPGQTFETDSITLHKRDLLEFAEEFDPQPYHLDSAAAEQSIFGSLCASGWQVCALATRLLTDAFRRDEIALMGIQDVPSLRWKIPVFVDDSLTGSIVITECQAQSDRMGLGRIACDVDIRNQKDQIVVVFSSTLLVAHAGKNPGEKAQKPG